MFSRARSGASGDPAFENAVGRCARGSERVRALLVVLCCVRVRSRTCVREHAFATSINRPRSEAELSYMHIYIYIYICYMYRERYV